MLCHDRAGLAKLKKKPVVSNYFVAFEVSDSTHIYTYKIGIYIVHTSLIYSTLKKYSA